MSTIKIVRRRKVAKLHVRADKAVVGKVRGSKPSWREKHENAVWYPYAYGMWQFIQVAAVMLAVAMVMSPTFVP